MPFWFDRPMGSAAQRPFGRLALAALTALSVALAQCSGSGGSGSSVPNQGSGATPSPSPSPSGSPSAKPSTSPSATPRPSTTPTPSGSPAATPTATPTPTLTPSPAPSFTPSPKPSATATASPTPSATPTSSGSERIYVVDRAAEAVDVFAANPSGTLNEAPLASIVGSNTGLYGALGIAVDASGKIYVANIGSPYSITVYAPNPSGTMNEAPIATITGSNTQLDEPQDIVVDGSGKIYVANAFASSGGSGSITVYAPNPQGTLNEAPIATIAGSKTLLGAPGGVALDASGRIYVANSTGSPTGSGGIGSITVYAANPTGTLNEAPVATIVGANTGFDQPYGIAIDAAGRIYAANATGSCGNSCFNVAGSVTLYAPNPSGTLNESPLATIAGSSTGLAGAIGMALDRSGKIYVANGDGQSVTVYGASPSGTLNETPLATITGSNTTVREPTGVALH